jgi:hypothetical protein
LGQRQVSLLVRCPFLGKLSVFGTAECVLFIDVSSF